MKKATILFLSCFISFAVLAGKLPGRIFIDPHAGRLFPGAFSSGEKFSGSVLGYYFVYEPATSAKITVAPAIGFQRFRYEQRFSDEVFIEHFQTGLAADLPAELRFSKLFRLKAGIHAFFPVHRMVNVGEEFANSTYYYSNDQVLFPYRRNPFQAGAFLEADLSPGKQQFFSFGVRITQMATSPVREDVRYSDALGETLTLSSKARPVLVEFHLKGLLFPYERKRVEEE